MPCPNVRLDHRRVIAAACMLGAMIAQTAIADCPPGYRSKAGHCVPGPAQPHHPWVKSSARVPSAVSAVHAKPHASPPKMIDKSKVRPQPGVPIEHRANAANTHGIIFVGGKNKAALNPQPIPPGHAKPVVPRKSHWNLKANKES